MPIEVTHAYVPTQPDDTATYPDMLQPSHWKEPHVISGAVETVNSVAPDASGNILLDAQDVQAVPLINRIRPANPYTIDSSDVWLNVQINPEFDLDTVFINVSSVTNGALLWVTNRSAEFSLTIDTDGSGNLNDQPSLVVPPSEWVQIVTNNGNAYVVNAITHSLIYGAALVYHNHTSTPGMPATILGDGAGNQTVIEADGTIKCEGSATVWNDVFIDGLSLTGGAADPPTFAAFIGGIWANSFVNGATNASHASFEMQHDYKEGTDVELHIHWSPSTTNAGNVRWGVEYTLAARSAVFPASTTVHATLAAGGVAHTHNSQNIATIPGTGITIGTVIRFRLFRLGNDVLDTFTGSAFLHRVGLHYECDTLGSRQTTVK